jgi:hypothetical protein
MPPGVTPFILPFAPIIGKIQIAAATVACACRIEGQRAGATNS